MASKSSFYNNSGVTNTQSNAIDASVNNAEASATASENSANNASASASTATTKASEASSSATSAASSATAASASLSGALIAASNLSDLSNASTARTNLGLGTAATTAATAYATAAQGTLATNALPKAGGTMTGNLSFDDNDKAIFGAGSDLQIYSDGTHSYLKENGSGNLWIGGANIGLGNPSASEYFIECVNNGAVKLYQNAALKLATTAIGIDVTGNIAVSGTVDGVDVATRDGILTSTTTTANAALPLTGGTLTGDLDISSGLTSTLRLSNTDTALTENQSTGQLEFYQEDVSGNPDGIGVTGKIGMRSVPNLGSNYYGMAADMDFYVSGQTNGYASDNASLKAMTIQAGSGNVGIGASSPQALIHLSGTNANIALEPSGTNAYFDNRKVGGVTNFRVSNASTNDTTAMVINSSGNVGIGTSAPSEALEVNGKIKADTHFTSSDGNVTLSTSGTGGNVYLRPNGSSTSTGQVIVVASGNVGIGNSSPSEKLDVAGTASVTNLKETVFTVTGTTPALDPANGGIQTWTLSGASTPTDSFDAGESITLMIDDGSANTITWPTMKWVGGSAPTLATTDYTVVVLWKIGSTLYGASIGDVA